jgi:glycosyltransferase involved in cell wall biosynthesis
MRVLVIAKLQASQIKYKLEPLLLAKDINEVLLIRKTKGPEIKNLSYIILPSITRYKIFYSILAPLYAIFYSYKFKPDFILSYHFFPHAIIAFIASISSSTPFIYSQIDLDIQNYLRRKWLSPFILFIVRRAKFIHVPGSLSKEYWIKKGIAPSKVNILHSTINVSRDYFPVTRSKQYDLVYIGSLEKRKQVDLIVRSINELKKEGKYPTFALTGENGDLNSIKELVKKFQLENQVTFIGKSNAIFELLNSSKIFIITSKNEGIPCALLEAMACELLVIACDVADVKDAVIDQTTGFVISGYSTKDISQRISFALENYESLLPIRKNAREHIVKYHSYESATLKWNDLIKNLP